MELFLLHHQQVQGGEKLFFDFEQTISRAEIMLSMSEREEFDFILSLINEGDTVFDVGANIGRFSLQVIRSNKNAQVYAFEPTPTTYKKMIRNLELNNISGMVHTYNMGFYDKVEKGKIFVPPSEEAASLRPVTDSFYLQEGNVGQGEIKNNLREMDCELQTLDYFVEKNGIEHLDLIKCDTEGAEKMVFTGARETLSQMKPIVYTEMLRKHAARFGYHPNEIIDLFAKLGYQCFSITEDEHLIPFTKMDESTVEANFLFLEKNKHGMLIAKYCK